MQRSALCVTLNPCLDKTLVVPDWQPGEHQVRGNSIHQVVGGKGVNVGRGLGTFGRSVCHFLPLGGWIGQQCEQLLRGTESLEPIIVKTEAPTREIVTIRTSATDDQTAFFDPNPTIRPRERAAMDAEFRMQLAYDYAWCVMSGSSPSTVTDDLYGDFVGHCHRYGTRTLVDTYGPSLNYALAAKPDVVKLNRLECEAAIGQPLDSSEQVMRALEWIRGHGVGTVIITFGAKGAVAATDDRLLCLQSPRVDVVNPIGAGDALAAGWVDADLKGWSFEEKFRWAVAASASSVRHWVACHIELDDVQEICESLSECDMAELTA